jgi:Lipocalin-like domain
MDQGTHSVVATWKLVSVVARPASGGEAVNVMGENPSGFLTCTSDGRMTAILASGGRQNLSMADPIGAPSAERAEAFAAFIAYAGGYTVEADRITHHVEVSRLQNCVGADQVRFARLQGNRLMLSDCKIISGRIMGEAKSCKISAWRIFKRAMNYGKVEEPSS